MNSREWNGMIRRVWLGDVMDGTQVKTMADDQHGCALQFPDGRRFDLTRIAGRVSRSATCCRASGLATF